MINAIIVDIDGTLADCSHRRHYVETKPKNWAAFYAGIADDTPVPIVRDLIEDWRRRGAEALLVSGRPDEHRLTTLRWLEKHGVEVRDLYMRRTGDYRPDTDVKREIYFNQIEPRYRVQLVLDDRASVVKMWRSCGLTCWQVADGEF